MIIEIVATLVTVCLTISEWLANPKRILERLHMGYSEELSDQTSEETEDDTKEESEFPIWDLDD